MVSLIVLRTTSARNDKSFTFLAIGLGLWFCAELLYMVYQVICKTGVPYPSIADFIWAAGYFFIGAYFYKTIKFWHETKRVKLYSIVIASFIIAGLIGSYIYLNLSRADDESQAEQECLGPLQQFPQSTIIFDLSYYLGDSAILIPALVTLSNLRIKDPFFFHRVLISIGVIISFLFGDILFINYANFGADILYNIGYICFALALIWYYKISQLLNNNLKHCIQQSDDMVKSMQRFIDKDNPEIKEPEGIFENIYNPTKAQDYLIRLLNEARKELQLVLLPIGVGYITKKIEVYNILLEKAKQSGLNIRVLLPYDKATEASISKLNYDSKYTIKIQYIRKWNKPNQIVLMVDNKLVLNLTLTKTDSGEDIKYAIYSSKESVVLCYTTMIEYQSLISDI